MTFIEYDLYIPQVATQASKLNSLTIEMHKTKKDWNKGWGTTQSKSHIYVR